MNITEGNAVTLFPVLLAGKDGLTCITKPDTELLF